MVISAGPMTAEWSIISRRPVATCRYVTGVTNIVKSNRRTIDICELEYAGLIVGVAGMHRHCAGTIRHLAADSRQQSRPGSSRTCISCQLPGVTVQKNARMQNGFDLAILA
jgi:hypothetical protein